MELVKDRRVEHVLDKDLPGAFWIQKEEELPYGGQYVKCLELFLQSLELSIIVDLVKNIVLKVPF